MSSLAQVSPANRLHVDPEVYSGLKKTITYSQLQSVLTDDDSIISIDGVWCCVRLEALGLGSACDMGVCAKSCSSTVCYVCGCLACTS